jgi:signal transduction histidine kinase
LDKEAVFAPIPSQKWSLAVTVPMGTLHQEAMAVRTRVVQVAAITVLLTVTAAGILSYHLLRPVRRLVAATQRISDGDLSLEIPIGSGDELGELTASFNRMVRDLARTQDELVRSAKLISLGRVSAGVAHEIRNPLNAMKAAMVHLKRRRSDDPLIVEYSKLIYSEIDRLNRFVTDFLLFAKQSPPRLEPADLNGLLSTVLNLFQEKAAESGVTLYQRPDPELPPLAMDPKQIEQVLVNLMVNAIEAMPNGGIITITSTWLPHGLDARDDRGLARITIRDTGPGIDPAHLASIFDPFFTTKEDGTGLGLPLSLGIVESHGGRLTVENQIGSGVMASVDLPAQPTTFGSALGEGQA